MAGDINIDAEWKMRHLDIQIALAHLHKNKISICTDREGKCASRLSFVRACECVLHQ